LNFSAFIIYYFNRKYNDIGVSLTEPFNLIQHNNNKKQHPRCKNQVRRDATSLAVWYLTADQTRKATFFHSCIITNWPTKKTKTSS